MTDEAERVVFAWDNFTVQAKVPAPEGPTEATGGRMGRFFRRKRGNSKCR